MAEDFTLVVCTRNRRCQLLQTLDSFALQISHARSRWAVVVVDNGSEDGTEAAVQQRIDGYPVDLRIVVEDEVGIGAARSRGLSEASGDVVVYLDDDVTLEPNWLPTVERAFADPRVDAAGGPIRTVYPERADPEVVAALESDQGCVTGSYRPGGDERCLTGAAASDLPHGANMALRSRVAREVGHFRRDLGWGKQMLPGEETDLLRRAASSGFHIWYLPGMSVEHHIQLEKIDWDYIRSWHLGYGRASIRMRDPLTPPGRLLRIVEQSLRWSRYALASSVDREHKRARTCRKRWQAEGRLRELFSPSTSA